MSDVKIVIGATGAFDELDAAIRGLEKLEKSYEGTRQAGQNIFLRANAAALEFTRNLERVDGKLNRESNTMRQLSGVVNGLGISFANAAKNQAIFSKDQHQFGNISKSANAAAVSLKNFNKQQEAVNREAANFGDVGGGLDNSLNKAANRGALLGTIYGQAAQLGVQAFQAVSRAIVDSTEVAARYETQVAALKVAFLGDEVKTSSTIKSLQDFAARTPFAFSEITQSFINLKNRGFEPTIAELTKIGDIASSQGKDFNQLTEAILDAQTGEFERLKEFGIRATANGDQVALSFRGQTIEVKKTDEAIRNAIINFGDLSGIQGSLAAQSATAAGINSNLTDSFEQLQVVVGGLINDGLKDFKIQLGELLTSSKDFIEGFDWSRIVDDPDLKALFDSLTQLNSSIKELLSNLTGIESSGDAFSGLQKSLSLFVKELNFISDVINKVVSGIAAIGESIGVFDALQFAGQKLYDAYSIVLDLMNGISASERKQIDATTAANNARAQSNKEMVKEMNQRGEAMQRDEDALEKLNAKTVKHTAATKDNSKAIKANIEDLKRQTETLKEQVRQAELTLADPEKRLELERNFQLGKIDEMEAGVLKAAQISGKEIDISDEVATLKKAVEKKYQEDLTKIIEQGVKERRSKEEKDRADELKAFEDFEKLKIKTLGEIQAESQADAQESQVDGIIDNLRVVTNAAIEADIETDKAFKSIGEKLADAFGLDPGDIEAITAAAGEIINGLQQVAQARVDEAEAAIEAAESKVDAAQTALDQELEFARLGFASNVDLRRQELESAKKAQETAEAEKKKAVKAQLALDTAVQASGLITSAVKIFEGLSGIPIVGPILAGVAIAAMFGTFIAAKKKAFDAVSLGEGGQGAISDSGVVMGPAHRDGGVPLEVEGGEFMTSDGKKFAVVNKRMTAKHFALLRAVNMDDRGGMAEALSQLVTPSVVLDHSVGDNVVRMQETIIMQRSDNKDVDTHKRLDKLSNQFNGVLSRMDSQEQRTETATHIIVRKGNKVTRIRK